MLTIRAIDGASCAHVFYRLQYINSLDSGHSLTITGYGEGCYDHIFTEDCIITFTDGSKKDRFTSKKAKLVTITGCNNGVDTRMHYLFKSVE